MKTTKKQKNTYQLTHARTDKWAGIFITASNYDDARIEFYRLMAEQGLNPKDYGMFRMRK